MNRKTCLVNHQLCFPFQATALQSILNTYHTRSAEDNSSYSSNPPLFSCIHLSALTYLSMFVLNSTACKRTQPEMSLNRNLSVRAQQMPILQSKQRIPLTFSQQELEWDYSHWVKTFQTSPWGVTDNQYWEDYREQLFWRYQNVSSCCELNKTSVLHIRSFIILICTNSIYFAM